MAGVLQSRPVVDDQAPGVGSLLAPLAGQLVQRFHQMRQRDVVVVQEAVGAQDGGKAAGQPRYSQGVDPGGQGFAHV